VSDPFLQQLPGSAHGNRFFHSRRRVSSPIMSLDLLIPWLQCSMRALDIGAETTADEFRPKMLHRPFLQITLCTRPLDLEDGPEGRNVSCQYITMRRRKNKNKGKGMGTQGGEADSEVAEQPGGGTTAGQSQNKNKAKRKKEGSGETPRTTRDDALVEDELVADTGDAQEETGPTGTDRTAIASNSASARNKDGQSDNQGDTKVHGGKRKGLDSSQTQSHDGKAKKKKKVHPA